MLANELATKFPASEVNICSLAHNSPTILLGNGDETVTIFLMSCFGQGQPTENAQEFCKWLHSQEASTALDFSLKKYAVFGLGNSTTHCDNYNAVGISVDARLEELGAARIHNLGLGDDSGCIEDDFDLWSEDLLKNLSIRKISSKFSYNHQQTKLKEYDISLISPTPVGSRVPISYDPTPCSSSVSKFHFPGTRKLKVIHHKSLSNNVANGMHELVIGIEGLQYTTGDHLWICPQNIPEDVSRCVDFLSLDPKAKVTGNEGSDTPYPFPPLNVEDTLRYCVDFGALPSPSLSRYILQRDIDYRSFIAEQKLTVLDLLGLAEEKPTLSQLLFNLPTMAPRYYSIASSSLVHKDELILVYRPVQYQNPSGKIHFGTCTRYMKNLKSTSERGEQIFIAGGVRHVPCFKLPEDNQKPLLFIAGGTGIAPVRAFLEERIMLSRSGVSLGPAYLFFGVRDKNDMVYSEMIETAIKVKALTKVWVAFSDGKCGRNISSYLDENAHTICNIIQSGGHVFLCGGAGGFATSCLKSIKAALKKCSSRLTYQGKAEMYFKEFVSSGRLSEDTAY